MDHDATLVDDELMTDSMGCEMIHRQAIDDDGSKGCTIIDTINSSATNHLAWNLVLLL